MPPLSYSKWDSLDVDEELADDRPPPPPRPKPKPLTGSKRCSIVVEVVSDPN